VLKTHDRVDLERLQQFTELMSDSPTSEPAYKVSGLASVLVSVAALYIESKEQDTHTERIEQLKSVPVTAQYFTSTDSDEHMATHPMP
jgi:hypothetical protein